MTNTILIVEDDEIILKLLSTIFSFIEQYDILLARDGDEALNMVQEIFPDLILLDIQLPKMNGYELCKTIKSNPKTSNVKVIMLTGLAQDYTLQRALEAGADACMTKPFSTGEIVEKVEGLLK